MKSSFLFAGLMLWSTFGQALPASADGERAYGYIPASQEELAAINHAPRYRAFIPAAADLSAEFPTPGDQGRLNSCVGWAVGHAARSYYANTIEGRNIKLKRNIPSPAFIFHSIRDPKTCEDGSKIMDALKLLEDKGSVSSADLPYSSRCRPLKQPIVNKASEFKIDYWQYVNPQVIDDIKGQIANGNPVVFGMRVGKRFERVRGQGTYKGELKTDGGHAMTAVGYDDSRQALKVINSWGVDWGNKGFGWIDYETFMRDAKEAYVMTVFNGLPKPDAKLEILVPEPDDPEPTEFVPKPLIVAPKPKPVVALKPISEGDCSRLVSKRVNGKTRISGFVGTPAALEQVQRKFAGSFYDVNVALRPWPQCEVLMTLENALDATDRPLISIDGTKEKFLKDEKIALAVTTPRKPSYIYVSYVQADGSVVHLQQPPSHSSAPSQSVTVTRFGDGRDGRSSFVASSPYGREMIVVVASASPLFDEKLPPNQSEREYLTALRKAIIYKADPSLPAREISAAFSGIETLEK